MQKYRLNPILDVPREITVAINLFEITGTDPDDPRVLAAGEDFDDFANLITALVLARKSQGLRQRDVAEIMETKQSVVSDLERIGGNPTIRTLQRYARAVGCRVRLVAKATASAASWTPMGNVELGSTEPTSLVLAPGSEFRHVA